MGPTAHFKPSRAQACLHYEARKRRPGPVADQIEGLTWLVVRKTQPVAGKLKEERCLRIVPPSRAPAGAPYDVEPEDVYKEFHILTGLEVPVGYTDFAPLPRRRAGMPGHGHHTHPSPRRIVGNPRKRAIGLSPSPRLLQEAPRTIT